MKLNILIYFKKLHYVTIEYIFFSVYVYNIFVQVKIQTTKKKFTTT